MRQYAVRSKTQRQPKDGELTLDAFVSQIYLPNIKIRKRSWKIDERIGRQHLSPASCNRFLDVFKTICSFAEKRVFLEPGKSPCLGVSSFKVHNQRERYLSQDEARRLMERLEERHRPEALALRLLLLTGARKSEILKARWENVNLEQRLLHWALVQIRQAEAYRSFGCGHSSYQKHSQTG